MCKMWNNYIVFKSVKAKSKEWNGYYNPSNPKQKLMNMTLVGIGDC